MSQRPIKKKDTLTYHQAPKPGKIEVIPTKPSNSQRDLSIAYSPGVAEPCKEIAANPEDVYKYTAKGNLVAVITNGTAVLGLGDIGPEASKACDGRERSIVQNLCRYRCVRSRIGRE